MDDLHRALENIMKSLIGVILVLILNQTILSYHYAATYGFQRLKVMVAASLFCQIITGMVIT
jgi:hypothetical protein